MKSRQCKFIKCVILEIISGEKTETLYFPVIPKIGEWVDSPILRKIALEPDFTGSSTFKVSTIEYVFDDKGKFKEVVLYVEQD